MTLDIELARKILNVVDQGLCSGLGSPEPGKMCVEAAVTYCLGEPHGDDPSCVSPVVRAFKIRLNDSRWSSNLARAVGMRKLAIAQLGSKGAIDEAAFCKELSKLTIQRVLPVILRLVGLAFEANRCEAEGSESSARAAARAAYADSAARADADSAADSAAYAAYAAAYAADSADSAARAARADSAADADSADRILTLSADACLDALRSVQAPGVALLNQLGL